MLSQRELKGLAIDKAAILERIDANRSQCVEAATQIARPLAWADTAVARWRRIPPLIRILLVPVWSLLLKRLVFRSRLRSR